MNDFKLALVQMYVGPDKKTNVANAEKFIATAAENGANMVILPECFNSPFGVEHFPLNAELAPGGHTSAAMRQAAKQHNVWLVAGSIPEVDTYNKLYNTSLVYDPYGNLVAKHRKVHLFDVDIPDKITFKESNTLTPGDELTTFQTEFGKFGVGISYDVRFTEMSKLYALQGCDVLIYPGCFNMTTGPAHWKLMGSATAVQQQVYTAMCSQARDSGADYVAWGHSAVWDPWGTCLTETDEKESIIYADIELAKVKNTRRELPLTTQRRTDLYNTVLKL